MKLIYASPRGGQKVKLGLAKESQNNSSPTHEKSSNTSDTQAHSYQSSIPQIISTTLSSTTDSYAAETRQSPSISEYQNYGYTLHSISAQFAAVHHNQLFTEVIVNQDTWSCPYHGPVLESWNLSQRRSLHETDTMSMYLNGNPSEQYALFYRPDTGQMSTERGCVCVHLGHGRQQFDLLETMAVGVIVGELVLVGREPGLDEFVLEV
jgi:hypothetical protein